MGTEERKLPGERILERLERRSRRRPRLGLVPEFYARLGVEDPWQEAQPEGAEGLVFLSASPFYQALRRLANARRRRDRRNDRFLARRAGTTMRAATRRLPGEARLASLGVSPFGGPTLREDAMRFFTPPTPEAPAPEPTVRVISAWGTPADGAQSAWLQTPYTPARTFKSTPAMTAAGDRLRRAEQNARVDRAVAASPVAVLPRARRALGEAVVAEDGPLTTRTVIRKVRRAAPVIEEIVVDDAPRIRPVRQAAGRQAAARGTGLRPVLSGSPSIALRAGAALDHAMAMAQAAPERLEAGRPVEGRRLRASARAAARDVGTRTGPRLSASPVVSAARVAAPAQAASEPGPARRTRGAAPGAGTGREGVGSVDGVAFAPPVYGLAARVAARSEAPTATLFPRMGRASSAMQLPINSVTAPATTARTPDGAFVPASVARAELAGTTQGRTTPAARTVEGAWAGARSVTTGGVDWTAATVGRAGARLSADFGAAVRYAGAELDQPWFGAASGITAGTLWAGARMGSADSTSLLPRIGITGPKQVLPRAAAPVVEAAPERIAANPWGVSDSTPARVVRTEPTQHVAARVVRTRAAATATADSRRPAESGTVAASARAFRTPTLSATGARVAHTPDGGTASASRSFSSPLGYAGPPTRGVRTPTVAWARAAISAGASRVEVLKTVIEAVEATSGKLGAVRTPDGRYVSARTALTMASKWDGARGVTTDSLPFTGARTGIVMPGAFSGARRATTPDMAYARAGLVRTPDGAWAPASSATTPDGTFEGANTARTRPTDWAGARSAVGSTAAYRGALSGSTPTTRFVSASTARTPDGVFVGATRASTLAGAFEGARRFATPDGGFDGAGRFSTPDGTFDGAGQFGTPDRAFNGAGRFTTASGSFTGADRFRTASGSFTGADRFTTAPGSFTGADRFTTPSGAFAGAGRGGAAGGPEYTAGARRANNTVVASDFSYPEPIAAAGEAGGTPRGRRSVFDTVAQLADGEVSASGPTWATRSTGEPRVRSGDALFDALAKATTANEVVRVIFQRAEGLRHAGPLAAPLQEVVQEIQREVVRVPVESTTIQTQRPIQVESPRVTTLSRSPAPARSTARRVRSSAAPAQSTARTATGGRNDRLSKLVKRLNDLIHLAENQRMGEALRQARLAENTASARAEGSAPLSGTGTDPKQLERVDQEALTREVVQEAVKKLEQNREQRAEDSDESNWW